MKEDEKICGCCVHYMWCDMPNKSACTLYGIVAERQGFCGEFEHR